MNNTLERIKIVKFILNIVLTQQLVQLKQHYNRPVNLIITLYEEASVE